LVLIPISAPKPNRNPSAKRVDAFHKTLEESTLFTTYLAGGKLYALSLFLILGAHEFGHYFAGLKNGVRTTLPLFIPAPPGLFLLGTFGAMIVIKDPIPNRRVLMEIGTATMNPAMGPATPISINTRRLGIGSLITIIAPNVPSKKRPGGAGIKRGRVVLTPFFNPAK
jgi:hypothetical protein